jgi:hypothetical protein
MRGHDDRVIRRTRGGRSVAGSRAVGHDQKRTDFLLRYRRDYTLAIVKAKPISKPLGKRMRATARQKKEIF